MEDWLLALGIIAGLSLFFFANMYAFGFIAASIIHKKVLTREKGKDGKWGRVCSDPSNPEQVEMWKIANDWKDLYAHSHQGVVVQSDGFGLIGDYYDFGNDKCVIIAPGRNETGIYSLYFAEPYRKAGYNVLVFDPRAHGLSTGELSYCGIGEANDVMAFAKHAHDNLHNQSLVLHGVCIGGGSIALLMGGNEAPSYVKGIVLDGLFTSFYEQFKNHLTEGGHPVWPVMTCLRIIIRKKTRCDIKKQAPIEAVKRIQTPTLLLAGEKDIYSRPDKTKKLFEALASTKKKLIWFKKGAHSHLKINDEQGYETAIVDWLKEI